MSVAVVTGAASGMGRACVDAVRDQVATVVAVDLVAPVIDGAVGVACDVTDAAEVASLVAHTAGLGPFRMLVHSAGISPTMGNARRVLEVDLVATERLLRAFESLVGKGSVAVCFASSAAHQIAPMIDAPIKELLVDPTATDFLDRGAAMFNDSGLAYAAAKHGVVLAAQRAAVRWGPMGGRVVSVSPGLIDTPMGRQELAQQPIMRDMQATTPLGRLGRAEEVAAVAAVLVSVAPAFV